MVNSLAEGHGTVSGLIFVAVTAGFTKPDVSARLFFPPAVVVYPTSWGPDATEVGVGSGVSAFSSPVPNIANGKNPKSLPIAGMVG